METSRYLSCLRHDAARLRTVAEGRLDDRVPSCPEWAVADLVRHVAEVYQHKTQSIRLGEKPQPWPPDPPRPGVNPSAGDESPRGVRSDLSEEEPLALLDRSLADLLKEFDEHEPTDHAWTWYPPDQSVGFWIRRMAQETVIHRVDAELAAGEVTAIPHDLAIDGIDEALVIHLGWDSFDTLEQAGPEEWPGLDAADGRVVRVVAGEDAWSVRPTPSGVEVASGGTEDTDGAAEAAAVVAGEPADVLLWLWRRGDDHRLSVAGDRDLIKFLHAQMAHATQ